MTRQQLIDGGVDRHTIQRWISDGRLRRLHRGVYAVGHRAPSLHGDYIAAVLAAGPDAVLSHRAAAHLLQLVAGPAPRPEVTIPGSVHRRRPGIVIHRVRELPRLDTSELDHIPITTVPRVLLDIAPRTTPSLLVRACHKAWVQHGASQEHIEACIARNPTKPGISKLRRATGSDVTLSTLEDGFLALLRAHGVTVPRTNIDRDGDMVDCHWPELDLTVELHSYRFHASRAAFEADLARRRRSEHLAFSYGDIFERGERTIAELVQRMAKSSKPSGSTAVTRRPSTVA